MSIDVVCRPCVVCAADVWMQSDSDEPALCIEDFFTEDPTAAWERDLEPIE